LVRDFLRRLATIPFESLFAIFAVYAGVAGLLHVGTSSDALDAVIGNTITTYLQVMYLASGVLMLLGLGFGKSKFEMPGLVFLATSVIVRGIAVTALVGITADTVGLLVLYFVILVACGVRLAHLLKGQVVVLIKPRGKP
jgi:hypothetical protein